MGHPLASENYKDNYVPNEEDHSELQAWLDSRNAEAAVLCELTELKDIAGQMMEAAQRGESLARFYERIGGR